ncbi:EamA family transporter [Sphingomonas spermidinifaciens]|uniref:EamA family transporter n=1 Tax=Sphingomonas spermidinifaciens TaxID=1141889 RepID=A0A2A4B6Y0_9SPHN|nr:DMT family transporter [Sphingomonas spermidinifaciens]PCD03549.1 EamA family transporter [Sphingomonas spermidinifaciens]
MTGDSILRGIALRLLAVALLATMGALVKLAETRGAGLIESMFFRQLWALPVVILWLWQTDGVCTIRTQRFRAHAGRTAAGLVGMTATFGVLHLLPLAEATTFQFTAPLFATLLGALWLREPTGIHRWSAVAAGFVGVLIIVQPGGHAIPLAGAAVGLASGFMIAVISVLLRQIGRTESAGTTVFWFSALSVPPLGLLWLTDLRAHPAEIWAILIAIGLIGGAGQIALTAALRHAPVSVVVPMDYSALLWATLLGWLIFGQFPSPGTWIGAPILIGCGIYIAVREHRRRLDSAPAVAQSSG